MPEYNETYLSVYKQIRKDISGGKASREINKSVPLELYIEWDRLRMILNPKAKISKAQFKVSEICR